jgi:aminopeptidase YwaD
MPGTYLLKFARRIAALALLLLVLGIVAAAQSAPAASNQVCADCLRKNLEYLAGPELHGRGSGTPDEQKAADFIATQLKAYGLEPAAENGSYIQTATVRSRTVSTAPVLTVVAGTGTQPMILTHGKEIAVFRLSQSDISAPLQKLDLNDASVTPAMVKDGAALVLKLKPNASLKTMNDMTSTYRRTKAVLVIVPEFPGAEQMFEQLGKRMPSSSREIPGEPSTADLLMASPETFAQLWDSPDATTVKLHADMTPWQDSHTWNVLAKIKGKNDAQIILLSAHLDHLGVKDGKTYPGADDDGSGTVAVMELARALAKQQRPQRTLVFALWGSEERGLVGARYFLKHPTFDPRDIVANLEFEMIGRADSKVQPNQLWLTGWERTDLGPALAAHGALLVGDPHPDQSFFMRSDNFALAKEGIVAQTVSSYGLHKDYHQPSDTLDKVDWDHLDSAVGSMIAPVSWLANSDFTPKWNAGMKP